MSRLPSTMVDVAPQWPPYEVEQRRRRVDPAWVALLAFDATVWLAAGRVALWVL